MSHGLREARPHRPGRVAHLPRLHELWRRQPGHHAWSLSEEESKPFIKKALEAGINFFDTANRYSLGNSEEILGRAIRDFARRDEVVITTKVYGRMRPGPNGAGLSRKAIFAEIDASLGRLGMDTEKWVPRNRRELLQKPAGCRTDARVLWRHLGVRHSLERAAYFARWSCQPAIPSSPQTIWRCVRRKPRKAISVILGTADSRMRTGGRLLFSSLRVGINHVAGLISRRREDRDGLRLAELLDIVPLDVVVLRWANYASCSHSLCSGLDTDNDSWLIAVAVILGVSCLWQFWGCGNSGVETSSRRQVREESACERQAD